MTFGKEYGPTGRRRDTFSVESYNRKGDTLIHARERYGKRKFGKVKQYIAHGQQGVKEAKKSVHREHPHTWMHFRIENRSRRILRGK